MECYGIVTLESRSSKEKSLKLHLYSPHQCTNNGAVKGIALVVLLDFDTKFIFLLI